MIAAPRFAGAALAVAMACSIAVPAAAQGSDLLQALRGEARNIATNTPINSVCDPAPKPNTCLMRSVAASGDFLHSTYDPNRIGELAAAWALPGEVAQQLAWIVVAERVTFTTFNFAVAGHQGSLTEYVGAARRVNGVAEVAVLRAHATAALHNRYSVTQKKRVSRSLCEQVRAAPGGCVDLGDSAYCDCTFGKPPSAYAWAHLYPRGLTADELLTVQQAMRASAYQHIMRLLGG